MNKPWLSAALVALVLGAGVARTSSAGELRAGAGKAAITTPAEEFPYSVPPERSFVGVHDDVFARALVLDDGGNRTAIVSVEVTAIPNPEQVIGAVAAAAKVAPSNVMVTATHTHNVPLVFYHGHDATPTQLREMARVQQGAVAATRQAMSSLQPARLSFGRGRAFVNINNGEQADLRNWADPEGSSDKSLDILRVQSRSGAPIALLLNYATHAEVMFRSVTRDNGYEVTGDLPGATSRILEGQATAAPIVLFTSAAEADQLPLFKSLQPDAELPATDLGAAGWGLLELQARRLASAALDTLAGMQPGTSQVRIRMASGAITCPGQHYVVDPDRNTVRAQDTAPVTIPLSVVHINDFAIAGVNADIASDIGRAIKQASPVPNTTVVTMLAGAVGYVLNDASYRQPGHGAMGSPVKPGCATRALSEGIARLLKTDAK